MNTAQRRLGIQKVGYYSYSGALIESREQRKKVEAKEGVGGKSIMQQIQLLVDSSLDGEVGSRMGFGWIEEDVAWKDLRLGKGLPETVEKEVAGGR